MNKKVWFIIAGVALVGGIATFIYIKKRKAAEYTPFLETPTDTPSTVVPGTGGGVPLPAGMAQLLRIVKDGSKGKAILRVSPKNLFKVGDTVTVNGSTIKGAYKVWYVYKAHATEDAVYIDTPYVSDDAGTVSLVK
jgi:LPXTG-motif cell wall-anchored protein